MGIPFYFRSIIRKYPNIVNARTKQRCKRLFLDFNCILHNSAAKISKIHTFTNYDELHESIMDDSLQYIITLIKEINPKDLVYVAIDGLCPRAKLCQQRKRRYLSKWRSDQINTKTKHQNIYTNYIQWDSNVITPGTTFMDIFEDKLNTFKNVIENEFGINIIVSTSKEVGEGEHKIYNYRKQHGQSDMDVIYGLDADLILLSLVNLSKNDSIFLAREASEFNIDKKVTTSQYMYLDIAELLECICTDQLNGVKGRIYDYVFLCTLIGNDFLPSLSCLKIKNEGLNLLVSEYLKITDLNPHWYVIDPSNIHGGVNMILVAQLLSSLSLIEDTLYNESSKQYYQRQVRLDLTKDKNEQLLDNYPSFNKFPFVINPETKGWRLSYYKHLFGDVAATTIKTACTKYVEGLFWVYEYYINGNPNFGWYYPFIYSPTILDMHNFCSTLQPSLINTLYQHVGDECIEHKEFMSFFKKPYTQLLCVLPPSSVNLIPNPKIHNIMNNIDHGCTQYFPSLFKLSTYLKTYLWECCPILPDIDIKKIEKAYDKLTVM